MKYAEFIWKNESSLDKGIVIEKQVQYTRPQERVERVEIPGRSGNLTLVSKKACYDVVLYSPYCYLKPGVKPELIGEYLSGRSFVEFGSMPGRKYDARLINQIPFLSQEENFGYKSFAPIFECQPLAYDASGEVIKVVENNEILFNPSNIEAFPVIEIKGTGNIDFYINEKLMTLTDLSGSIRLDTELMVATDLTQTAFLNSKCSGNWPVLEKGQNKVSFSGNVNKVTFKINWRWL